MWRNHSTEAAGVRRQKSSGIKKRKRKKTEERRMGMFRTLEEHAERFYGKRPGLLMRAVRFKGLVVTSMLVIGILLTVVMSLD